VPGVSGFADADAAQPEVTQVRPGAAAALAAPDPAGWELRFALRFGDLCFCGHYPPL